MNLYIIRIVLVYFLLALIFVLVFFTLVLFMNILFSVVLLKNTLLTYMLVTRVVVQLEFKVDYMESSVRSSAMLLSCRVCLPGVGALRPCKETERDTE